MSSTLTLINLVTFTMVKGLLMYPKIKDYFIANHKVCLVFILVLLEYNEIL